MRSPRSVQSRRPRRSRRAATVCRCTRSMSHRSWSGGGPFAAFRQASMDASSWARDVWPDQRRRHGLSRPATKRRTRRWPARGCRLGVASMAWRESATLRVGRRAGPPLIPHAPSRASCTGRPRSAWRSCGTSPSVRPQPRVSILPLGASANFWRALSRSPSSTVERRRRLALNCTCP